MTLPHLASDLKYGARMMSRTRGFTLLAVSALALGIGANTAVFSVVDAVLVRPLPFPEPDQLVMVWEDASKIGFPRNTPAPANWVDWRKRNTVFQDIAATRGAGYNLTGEGAPEQVIGRRVTANLWTILGVQPRLGRVFTDQEDTSGEPVAVISDGLWQRRFGGDASAVGRPLSLNGRAYTVIGVMPPDFLFLDRRAEIWTPAAFTPKDLATRGSHYLNCVGRLKAGVSLAEAQSQMTGIADQLRREFPDENLNTGVALVPVREQIVGDTRVALVALLCAAGCVLLIACANIANLLLARGIGRQREFALRAALGAGRRRLVAQLATESLLLSAFGAMLGLGVAWLGMKLLTNLIPQGLPAPTLAMNLRLLMFTLVVALATGVLFGVAPALASAFVNANDALKQGGRGSAGGRRHWFRDALVVTQVALALLLASGAGLMIRTVEHYQSVDPGFRKDHLLTALTFLPDSRYPDHAKRVAFVDAVLANVRNIPGVTGASYTSDLPLITQGNTSSYILEGQDEKETQTQDAQFRVSTVDYFPVIGARLREGRFFTAQDHARAQPVVIVNETLANRHFKGQSALGKRLQIGRRGPEHPWPVIAGVVKEIRERGINIPTKPVVYMPLAQAEKAWPQPAALVVRTTADPLSIVPSVRQAVWAVDKDQPLARIRTMDEVAEIETAGRRQTMTLLGIFAGLSVLLAVIGVYGVLAYSVSQRTKEIGVRVALGSDGWSIMRLIGMRGVLLAGLGVALGLAATLASSRLLEQLLFGVQPNDPGTLAGGAGLLLAVAVAASLLPAVRASRIDPATALREE